MRLESSGEQIRVKATNLREAGKDTGSNNSNNPRAAAEALARQAVALGRQHQVCRPLNFYSRKEPRKILTGDGRQSKSYSVNNKTPTQQLS